MSSLNRDEQLLAIIEQHTKLIAQLFVRVKALEAAQNYAANK